MLGPAWSPDSTKIAFSWVNLDAVPVAGKDIGDTESIYIVNRDGSGLKQIVKADNTAVSNPTWSPSPRGNQLVYEKKVLEDKHLFKIDLSDGNSEQLTHKGDNSSADWFDPMFALPVSPQPQLLTTVWGKIKIGD